MNTVLLVYYPGKVIEFIIKTDRSIKYRKCYVQVSKLYYIQLLIKLLVRCTCSLCVNWASNISVMFVWCCENFQAVILSFVSSMLHCI